MDRGDTFQTRIPKLPTNQMFLKSPSSGKKILSQRTENTQKISSSSRSDGIIVNAERSGGYDDDDVNDDGRGGRTKMKQKTRKQKQNESHRKSGGRREGGEDNKENNDAECFDDDDDDDEEEEEGKELQSEKQQQRIAGVWSPLPPPAAKMNKTNRMKRIKREEEKERADTNNNNNNNNNNTGERKRQKTTTTTLPAEGEKIDSNDSISEALVAKLLQYKPKGKTQFDHIGKMKAMTDFIETKLKPAVKSLSREMIEYKVISEQATTSANEQVEKAKEALQLTESKYAAVVLERETLVKECGILLEKHSANEKAVADFRATLEETNRILENTRASTEELELKLSESRHTIGQMKEEQNLTRQKLEDALTQKTESVENVQKLLAEKAGMMMELGELKGIRSQIETQIQSANARAETIAKECETVKEEANDLKREIARLTIECEKKQEKANSFQSETESMKANIARVLEENNVYRIQLETSKSDGEKLLGEFESLRKEKEKLEELKAQLLEANSEIKCSKVEVNYTKSECEMLKKQCEASKEDKASMMCEFERVKGDLERAVETSKKDAVLLDEKFNAEREKFAKLESLYEQVLREKEHLEETVQQKERQNREQQQLRLQHQSKSKDKEGEQPGSCEAMLRIAALEAELLKAEAVRREMFNQIQELRGNVRVFCRVRPPSPRETSEASASICLETLPDVATVHLRLGPEKSSSYAFNRVFSQESTQEDVFGEVSGLVQSALDGYNVCLFSYGQTGSGKTHTMLGGSDATSRGIIPRAVEKVVEASKINEVKGWSYTLKASYVEIYNETIRDLLSTVGHSDTTHKIIHENGSTTISGVTTAIVESVEQANVLVRKAAGARKVEATQMNAHSSRSHAVFILHVSGEYASSGTRMEGVLNLVDLAGSERVSRSGASGERLKEACSINKSLSSLGDVFAALASKAKHVPYRNSKLTYLLAPCLGGDGKTLMFVNVSPEEDSSEETSCSLRFAEKVNACELGRSSQRKMTTHK